MKTLLSLLVVLATSSAALSAIIPFGYDCTSDLQSICEGDENSEPSPEPSSSISDGGTSLSTPTDD